MKAVKRKKSINDHTKSEIRGKQRNIIRKIYEEKEKTAHLGHRINSIFSSEKKCNLFNV